MLLKMDNNSTQMIIEVPRFSPKLKHITIRELFISHAVSEGLIKLEHVCSKGNIADVFTKVLKGEHFSELKSAMVC